MSKRFQTLSLRRKQLGLTITEALLTLGIASAVATGAYGVYKTARADVDVDELASSTVKLVSDVQNIFGTTGGYASVTAPNVSTAGLVPAGWRYTGGNLIDNRGNVVTLTAGAGSFALTFTNLTASDCTKAAAKLEGISVAINVGSAATSAAGVVSGGSAFKTTAGVVNNANLVAGCGQDGRRIALQVR